jgi:hypothetical protein
MTRLRTHVAVLVVALALALALSERSTGFTVDEGSYAIQAHSIDDGGWAIHWPFRTVDPDGDHFPYHGGAMSASQEFAYVSHPAWPAVLSITRDVGGEEVGLRLVSLASVVAAAVLALHVATSVGGTRAGRWAFWIVATSPVLPDGLMVWAHAPSAALAGLASLAVVRLLEGRHPLRWTAVLAVALAAGVLLRSESLLFAGAVVAVVGIAGLSRRSGTLIAAAVAGAVGTGGALFGERLWTAAVVDGELSTGLSSRAGGSSAWLQGRFSGAVTAVLDGALGSTGAAACTTAALALMVLVVVAVHRPGLQLRPPLLVGAAAALMVARLVVAADDPVPGLLAACPVLVLGLLAIRRDRTTVLALAVIVVLFAAAVLGTQYDDGGGLQWGGRYLSPALVPLGVLAGVALADDRLRARATQAAATALLVATAVAGVVVTDQVRSGSAGAIAAVGAERNPVVLVDGDQLARLDWLHWPERCWIATGDELPDALRRLAAAGIGRVTSVAVPPTQLEAEGATVVESRRQRGVASVELGPGGSSCPVGNLRP